MRYVQWVPLGGDIRCSRGHRVRLGQHGLTRDGLFACSYRAPGVRGGDPPCGDLLWVLAVRRLNRVCVAAVTQDEWSKLQWSGLSLPRTLDYLGIPLPTDLHLSEPA